MADGVAAQEGLADYLRRRFAWLQRGQPGALGVRTGTEAPLSLQTAGDALGVAGTLRDIVVDEAGAPFVGSLIAARDEANRHIPGWAGDALNRSGSPLATVLTQQANPDAPRPEVTREGLAVYGREQAKRQPLGEFFFETAADPTTYFPTATATRLLGAGAKTLPGVLGQVSGALAKVGPAYDEAASATLRGAGGLAQAIGTHTPGLNRLMELAPTGELARYLGQTGNALQTALRFGARNERSIYDLMDAAGDPPARAQLGTGAATRVADGWDTLGERIAGQDHALKQMAGTALMDDAMERANWAEAEARKAADEVSQLIEAGDLSAREGNGHIATIWTRQLGQVNAIRSGLGDAVGALDTLDAATLPAVPTGQADAIGERVRQTVAGVRDARLTGRDLATAMAGDVDRDIPGLLAGGDLAPLRRLADDRIAQQATEAARDLLGGMVDEADDMLRAALPGEDVGALAETVMRHAREAYGAAVGGRPVAGQSWWERAGGIDPKKATTLGEEKSGISKAFRVVDAARSRLIAESRPLLGDYYRGLGLEAAEVEARTTAALADTTVLTRELNQAKAITPGIWPEVATIEGVLQRYQGVGDLLRPSDGFHLTMDQLARSKAKALGIEPPPPWLSWYFTLTGVWRDMALLSPRYHEANLFYGLFAASRSGASPVPILQTLHHNLRDIHAQMTASGGLKGWAEAAANERVYVHRVHAESAPAMAKTGRVDAEGYAAFPYELQQQIESMAASQGTEQTVRARGSAVGRFPRAGWSAITGGLAGGTTYMTNGDLPEEERRAKALGNAAIGAGAGAALPTFVWASRLLGKAIEGALRTGVFVQGMEKGLADVAAPAFKAAAEGLRTQTVETIGRPIVAPGTLPGMGEVRGLRDILGIDRVPSGYRGVLKIKTGDPATVLRREVPAGALDGPTGLYAHMEGRAWQMSPREVTDFLVARGTPAEQADGFGSAWDAAIGGAEDAGLALNARVNFDYADVSRLTHSLRTTGVFPFITWSIKAMPQVATFLMQDPRLLIAVDRLNNLSDEDVQEAGLSTGYERMARLGILGDWLAEQVLGRPDATMLGQPWSLFMPFAEAGTTVAGDTPIERGVDAARQVGLSLGPAPTLGLQATGLLDFLGLPVARTTPYLEALTGTGTGLPVNIERGPAEVMRGARRAMGVEDPKTETGNVLKDYAIRQRIAEMAFEATGKPPAGDWKAAMDDPESTIWKLALRQVERQQGGQTVLSSVVPFKTRALGDTQATVQAARQRQGIAARDLAAMPQAERSPAWKRAEAADPTVSTFSSLGADWKSIAWRQKPAQEAEWKRTARMKGAEQMKARAAYLADKPELTRLLMEGRATF